MQVLEYLTQRYPGCKKGGDSNEGGVTDEYRRQAKKGYSLILTEKERERLGIIVAAYIDLALMPQLTEAGKIGNTQRLMELTWAIELEKGILAKLY